MTLSLLHHGDLYAWLLLYVVHKESILAYDDDKGAVFNVWRVVPASLR